MINFINRGPRSNLKSTLGVNRLAFEISLLVQQVAGILIIQGKLESQSPGSHWEENQDFHLKRVFNSCHQGFSLQLSSGSKGVFGVVVSCFS